MELSQVRFMSCMMVTYIPCWPESPNRIDEVVPVVMACIVLHALRQYKHLWEINSKAGYDVITTVMYL